MTTGPLGTGRRSSGWVSNYLHSIRLTLTRFAGVYFLRRIKEAFEMHEKHQEIFEQYSMGFEASLVAQWEATLRRWEKDPANEPDPFEEAVAGMLM